MCWNARAEGWSGEEGWAVPLRCPVLVVVAMQLGAAVGILGVEGVA